MIAALTNHLWQSTLFAVVVGLLALALGSNKAQIRYWLWLGASLKFLIPFSLLIGIGHQLQSVPAAQAIAEQIVTPSVSTTMVQITRPFSGVPPAALPQASAASLAACNWLPVLLLNVWFVGFCAIVFMRVRAWHRVQAALRSSTLFENETRLHVRTSPALFEPGVVGLRRPILLLPAGIFQALTPHQLEAVLAHELCHVKRRDNLTSTFHMVVEAVFWFHPLVWWIGARLVDERERACDEEVLRLGNEPLVYAEGILNVCKIYQESPLACVSGVTGSDLKKRIENIMRNRFARRLGVVKAALLTVAAIAMLAGPIAAGVVRPMVTSPARVFALKVAVAAPVPSAPIQAPQSPRPAASPEPVKNVFDVVSIRPADPQQLRGGGPRDGGAGGGGNAAATPAFRRTCGNGGRLTPGRLEILNVTAYRLITLAYGLHCRASLQVGLIAKGPDWMETQPFDIRATLPAGTPPYRQSQLQDGEAPEIEAMLRNMLAERFGLTLHRDSKEASLYNLVVVRAGKMALAEDQSPLAFVPGQANVATRGSVPRGALAFEADSAAGQLSVKASSLPISTLVQSMQGQDDHFVVDKTGLKGLYDFEVHLKVTPFAGDPGLFWPEIVQELGLKLEPARGPVEVLVIDKVEKPTEN